MIAHISGTLIAKETDSVVIGAGGIGYKVYVTPATLTELGAKGSEVALHTHLSVRETALDLFGFLSVPTLTFFTLLIGVSGIGPKSALAITGLAPTEVLQSAIAQGDTSYLTKVSGIGKKSAEKIVIELRDKVGAIAPITGHQSTDTETLEALLAMGYSREEAREAIQAVDPEITDAQERIKSALKNLL